jgi:hypothetical protein
MNQTVVGTFISPLAAQGAFERLTECGFEQTRIRIQRAYPNASGEERGVMERLRNVFIEVFGPGDSEADGLAEAVRRGSIVIAVDVNDPSQLGQARQTLVSAGATTIEEKSEAAASQP